jgi:hypothetical protein
MYGQILLKLSTTEFYENPLRGADKRIDGLNEINKHLSRLRTRPVGKSHSLCSLMLDLKLSIDGRARRMTCQRKIFFYLLLTIRIMTIYSIS